jgi:hypothetical protein
MVGAATDVSVHHGPVLRPVIWMFAALLVTFLVTRLVTRWIRSRRPDDGLVRDVIVRGVHIHHQVFGILIMFASGLALIATTSDGIALDVVAASFGVGAGLTFDEFALWLHLRDVYWTTEGRKSADAIFCVVAITGIMMSGLNLVVSGKPGSEIWWYSVAELAFNLGCCVICLLKGKTVTGVIGMVSFVGIIGAIRLAKPDSWWAQRFYLIRPRQMARAQRRFGPHYHARWNRVRDLIAGAPHIVGQHPDVHQHPPQHSGRTHDGLPR